MVSRVPNEKNPYAAKTPFDVLGVSSSASAKDLVRSRDRLLDEIKHDRNLTDEQRFAKTDEVQDAYKALRGKSRFAVEIFFFDAALGKEQCQASAEQTRNLTYDCSRILRKEGGIFRTEPVMPNIVRSTRVLDGAVCTALKPPPPADSDEMKKRVIQSIQFDL